MNFEKVSFKNGRDKTLRGHLYRSSTNSIIIMAHGFTSDKYSRGRFEILAKTFTESGFNVLTFDFSGCGESDDDSLTAAKEVEDLQSAMSFATSKGYNEIGLYGHSLGSFICLKCYSDPVKAIVISGALTGPMYYDWNEFFSKEQIEELKQIGRITIYREDKVRERLVIDAQMLKDFEEFNQQELLEQIKCPVLIIHGNHPEDEEELQLLERSKEGIKYLSEESALKVIEGATHSFLKEIDILADLANNWFQKYLKQ